MKRREERVVYRKLIASLFKSVTLIIVIVPKHIFVKATEFFQDGSDSSCTIPSTMYEGKFLNTTIVSDI